MVWIVGYLLVGAFFALMGLYGMQGNEKSAEYKFWITIGLIFIWPIMIGGVIVTVVVVALIMSIF